MTFEEFEDILFELAAELPEELFQELDGGIMAREEIKYHPAAVARDLLILGEYHRDRHLSRFVVLYYGSFMACFGQADESVIRREMWRVLRHEFLHHIESLAGENSLEVEDAIKIAAYKRAHPVPY